MPGVPGVCAGACRLKALRKRFEPGELERHFFTEFDMTVVAANVPERLQFLVPNRTRLLRETAAMGGKEGEAARETEDDRTDEASWILQRLEFNRNVAYKSDKLTAAIAQVLKFVFDDLLEVGRSVHRRATTLRRRCRGCGLVLTMVLLPPSPPRLACPGAVCVDLPQRPPGRAEFAPLVEDPGLGCRVCAHSAHEEVRRRGLGRAAAPRISCGWQSLTKP